MFSISFVTGRQIQVLSSLIATFGILGFGIAHLWPSPAIPKLLLNETELVQITTSESSWVASIEMLTIPFASFGTIYLMNYFGAKSILLLAPFPLVFSWVFVMYANHIYYIYFARCLVGISEAFFYNSAPVYISEIAEPNIRGILMYFVPIMFNIGGLIVYYFGYIMSLKLFAALSIIPSVIYFVLFLVMPESPYYYIIFEKFDKAKDTLKVLRGKSYSDQEFEVIKKSIELEMSDKGSIKMLFDNPVSRKSLLLITLVQLVQQLCGSSCIANYLHLIIKESNFDLSVEIVATLMGVIILVGSMASTLWVDRKGRRPVILVSIIGVAISIILEGIYFLFKENGFNMESVNWLPSIFLAVYIFFVNFGLINMAVLLAGELFPTNVKNYGVSVVFIAYGVFGFLTNKAFQVTKDMFGMSYIFLAFGLFSLIGYIFVYIYLPETRNKTLAEIQTMLKSNLVV